MSHFVKLPLVCRLLQGFFNIMPALPRYVTSSEVTKVFTFIKSKATLTDYALKTISHRLAMILCLTTGQRSMFVWQNETSSTFLRLSKVWSMLNHESVGWVQNKECYFMFSSTFWHVYIVFYHKICVFNCFNFFLW